MNAICLIDGTNFDLSKILNYINDPQHDIESKNKLERSEIIGYVMEMIQNITNIQNLAAAELAVLICNSKSIPESFDASQYKREEYRFETIPVEKLLQPKCPKCGSTFITTGARGINWLLGPIGASKTVNRCAKCGHVWEPHL